MLYSSFPLAVYFMRGSVYFGEGNGTPLQYSCLENPMDGGAWWAEVHGVAEGRTWLSDFTFTFHFHALEKEMATHSSVLAWRIPGTGEPGGLPSMGSRRVGPDWSDLAAAAAAVYFMRGSVYFREDNGTPLQYSCLENPRDGGAWWAAVCGVPQSWTRLKRLSSSSVYLHYYLAQLMSSQISKEERWTWVIHSVP